MRLGLAGAACRLRPCRRLPRPPPPFRPPSASRPSGVKPVEEAGAQPGIAGSLARTLPLFRGRACNAYHETACAPAIWEIQYLPSILRLPVHRSFGVANLDDEEWARSSSISAPRVGSFDILFVGGHEAVCAVAIEAPPPIPRPRSRPLDLSDACAHPSAADSRASTVADGRGERAPCARHGRTVRVDDGGRASGAARPRRRRAQAKRRRSLSRPSATTDHRSAVADRRSCGRGAFAAAARWTARTARSTDASAAGARLPRASVAPLAAPRRARRCAS